MPGSHIRVSRPPSPTFVKKWQFLATPVKKTSTGDDSGLTFWNRGGQLLQRFCRVVRDRAARWRESFRIFKTFAPLRVKCHFSLVPWTTVRYPWVPYAPQRLTLYGRLICSVSSACQVLK